MSWINLADFRGLLRPHGIVASVSGVRLNETQRDMVTAAALKKNGEGLYTFGAPHQCYAFSNFTAANDQFPPRVENNRQVYNNGGMNYTREFIQAAHESGLTPDELRAAVLAAKQAKEAAKAETTQRATPRPQWPRDALDEERDNPAAFAWRAYAAEAKAGTLHRGLIGQEDKRNGTKLAYDLEIWLRRKKNKPRLPEGFDIPTKPEWNTRQLAKVDPAKLKPARRVTKTESTPESRLYEVARTRAANSTSSQP